MRIALTLGVLIAVASPAHAGRDIGVVVAGESWMQPQLVSQIEAWLSQHGHSLVALPPDALDALKQCFLDKASGDLSCARSVVEQRARATSVIYARLDARSSAAGAPDLTVTAYWFDRGHDATYERKTCPRCTDQSLRSTADEILKKLVGGGDLGHIKLKSAPPGATITIDGQAIGITPLDWDLPAGKHSIQMDKTGLKPATRNITIAGNKSDLLVMTLTADGSDDHDDGSSSTLSPKIPWGMAIGGGIVAVAGAGLIVFSPGAKDDQRYYTSTRTPGIALAIGGGAISAFGVGWLLLRSPRAASAPVATFTGDSAYIGWLGKF
jgi:hypothetical protein